MPLPNLHGQQIARYADLPANLALWNHNRGRFHHGLYPRRVQIRHGRQVLRDLHVHHAHHAQY